VAAEHDVEAHEAPEANVDSAAKTDGEAKAGDSLVTPQRTHALYEKLAREVIRAVEVSEKNVCSAARARRTDMSESMT